MEPASIDSLERQTEINEWEYHRKLETLFMLQIIFLGIVILVILSVLWRYQLTNIPFIGLVGITLIVCVVLLWFYRASYTKNVRDKNSWNRRRFPGDGSTRPAVSPEEVAAEAKKRIAAYDAAVAAGKACPRF